MKKRKPCDTVAPELHVDYPFARSRMMQGFLKQEGFEIGRKHTATLMKEMGIEVLYHMPRTSKPEPGHKIFLYLLHQVKVERPNQGNQLTSATFTSVLQKLQHRHLDGWPWCITRQCLCRAVVA